MFRRRLACIECLDEDWLVLQLWNKRGIWGAGSIEAGVEKERGRKRRRMRRSKRRRRRRKQRRKRRRTRGVGGRRGGIL